MNLSTHAPRFVVALVFVFFASWCVGGHAVDSFSSEKFYSSSVLASEAMATDFRQFSFSPYFIFNGYLVNALGNSVDGHSCFLTSAAFLFTPDTVPANANSVYRYNYWYCPDGYMGGQNHYFDYMNKDIWLVIFIVGLVVAFGLGFVGGQQR